MSKRRLGFAQKIVTLPRLLESPPTLRIHPLITVGHLKHHHFDIPSEDLVDDDTPAIHVPILIPEPFLDEANLSDEGRLPGTPLRILDKKVT